MTTENKILKYFKDKPLKNLDNGFPELVLPNRGYVAVSLDYIHKYVLKKKVTKKFIAKTLFKLIKNKEILPIPCSYAMNLLFCNYKHYISSIFCKYWINEENTGIQISLWDEKNIYGEKIREFNSMLK